MWLTVDRQPLKRMLLYKFCESWRNFNGMLFFYLKSGGETAKYGILLKNAKMAAFQQDEKRFDVI